VLKTPLAQARSRQLERTSEEGMKKTRPLIERYLTYLRISGERARARIRQSPYVAVQTFNTELFHAYSAIYTGMADRAIKYRLAASAQAMIDALRPRPLLREDMSLALMDALAAHRREPDPDIETPIHRLPDTPIWMELEQPISTNTGEIAGLFFASADREIERELAKPQTRAQREVLLQAGRQADEEYKWSLHFIDAEGVPTSQYEYHEQSQQWAILPDVEPCPTEECEVYEEVSDLTGRRYKHIIPCVFCSTILAYWRSWLVTALLAVQGEFAASDEPEWPRHTEHSTRKVQRPGSYKFEEKPVSHDYYYVSFDASVKQRGPASLGRGQEHEPEEHGSWVAAAQEIDPESVVYVRLDFGQVKRQLDPERNPRWKRKQVIDVKAHARRVPMKVENLQRKVIRVIASHYEQPEEE
jgi:hypothetical protein